MRFRCNKDTLAETVGAAARASSSRNVGSPALSGIRLEVVQETLRAVATDLDLTIEAECAVGDAEAGIAVVPSRLFVDIVRALEPGSLSVQDKDGDLEIVGARAHFLIRTIVQSDFPVFPLMQGGGVVVNAIELGSALRQVVRAASSDDSRPLLTGVLLSPYDGGIRAVATDSYRLALRDVPGLHGLTDGKSILVPARALGEFQRFVSAMLTSERDVKASEAEALVSVTENDATFQVGPIRLVTRLLDGAFPDYAQLIPPSFPNRLQVDKETLVGALRRVRLLLRDNTTPVRMDMSHEGASLSVMTHDLGTAHEDIDAAYEGTNLTIAFNPAYLLDGIEAVIGDDVVIETVDTTKPAVIRAPDRTDFQYLLMPVRVS